MKILMLCAIVVTALVAAPASQAHYGDRWFTTKSAMQDGIEAKYRVSRAGCIIGSHSRYPSHKLDKDGFGVASYDHFACVITSEASGRVCAVYAHVTGQRWFHIVLTSITGMRGVQGCTPRDLRTRPYYWEE